MKHRADVRSLGAALLLALAAALVGPIGDPDTQAVRDPAPALQTPNPSKAPWVQLGLFDLLVYLDPTPTEPHVFTLD